MWQQSKVAWVAEAWREGGDSVRTAWGHGGMRIRFSFSRKRGGWAWPAGMPRPRSAPALRGTRGFPAALRSQGDGLASEPSACAKRG